jgi:hypothetical protein
MVAWIRENKPAKLAGLWESVLPEGSTAPPAEYAADLFWLLQQGHILLYTDDTLVVQEVREPTPPKEPKKKKSKGPKAPKAEGEAGAEAAGADEAAPADDTAEASASDNSEAAPEAEELLQEPVALETLEVTEAEQSTIDSTEPEAPAEEANGEEDGKGKLPDSDFAEPSEAPQQPEPENTADALPDSDFAEPSEAPQKPEPEGDDSEKLPDSDFAEPSEQPQKPE